MNALHRDRMIGGVLFLIAFAWIAASHYAIPNGYSGSAFGPSAFPFWLGVLLAALSLMMVAATFRGRPLPKPAPSDVSDEAAGASAKDELWGAAAVFGFLILLFFSIWLFGFPISTTVLAALFLWFVLGSRSVLLTVLLAVGLGVGIWYAMSRFLGVYLPTGIWGF